MSKPLRHSKGDLEQMQSLPLRIKITMTERRIFDWYEYWGGDVYLSFSGGKDSTVLKHIIDNMGINVPSLFVNTGLEYPEIQKFAMSQNNVTTVRPKMMFTDVLKQYGYPIISKEVSKTIKEARNSPKSKAWDNSDRIRAKRHMDEVWKQEEGFYVCPYCGNAEHEKSPYCRKCGKGLGNG